MPPRVFERFKMAITFFADSGRVTPQHTRLFPLSCPNQQFLPWTSHDHNFIYALRGSKDEYRG